MNVIPEESQIEKNFVLRGPTGKKAEEFFINFFYSDSSPFEGTLIDCRDNGCGYDFEVVNDIQRVFIEVKGLSGEDGGLVFTNKEWSTAKKNGEHYYLIFIRNLNKTPEVTIVQNPFIALKSQKSIYTSIQIQWIVSPKELKLISS
nr:DUF3883 domain-containing protein [Rufibacter sediminis]